MSQPTLLSIAPDLPGPLADNSFISEPLRGIRVYAGRTAEQTDGTNQHRSYVEAAKFDFEGAPLVCPKVMSTGQ